MKNTILSCLVVLLPHFIAFSMDDYEYPLRTEIDIDSDSVDAEPEDNKNAHQGLKNFTNIGDLTGNIVSFNDGKLYIKINPKCTCRVEGKKIFIRFPAGTSVLDQESDSSNSNDEDLDLSAEEESEDLNADDVQRFNKDKLNLLADLVKKRKTSQEIEDKLGVTRRTLDHYLSFSYRKKILKMKDVNYLKHKKANLERRGITRKHIEDFLVDYINRNPGPKSYNALYKEFNQSKFRIYRNITLGPFHQHELNLFNAKRFTQEERDKYLEKGKRQTR